MSDDFRDPASDEDAPMGEQSADDVRLGEPHQDDVRSDEDPADGTTDDSREPATTSGDTPADTDADPGTFAADDDAEQVYWADDVIDVSAPDEPEAVELVDPEGVPAIGDPELLFAESADADLPVGREVVGEHVDAGVAAAGHAAEDPLGAPLAVDMGPERRSRWWVWVLAGLLVAAIAGGSTYGWWWMTERPIVVPDLVGRQAADATQALNDVDLVLGKVSEVPTDVAPVGTVISQKPEAGSRLKPDAKVSFVLATAPEQAKVPNVVGLSVDDAAVVLAEARLRPHQVRSNSATVAAGFVIGQIPSQGAELMPGNPVALAVSKGPAPGNTAVPSITGLGEGDAVALIGARGLTARVYQSVAPSIGAGIVVTQTPLPNTSIAPGASVQVLVSKGFGTGTVTVPDVLNDARKEAIDAVKAAGLKAATVFQFHPTVARGTVISQMPLPGQRVQSDDTVGLLISRGPLTTALVPSIIGSASAEATAAVANAGFKPVVVEVEMPGKTAGTVLGQFPAPSSSYELRYPVICLVAKAIEP